MNKRIAKSLIHKATFISIIAFATATSAYAQTEPADNTEEPEGEEIIVTGSLLRNTANDTPSPVSVLTSESLDQRGIQTTQDALQRLASNNGPAITQSFTANGAFAGGASAISLRGLSTSSTLVLFDGMRAAYYPLADDGTRNFVDLNTIPDDIVDRIEVLRDGASATYGADAIAGVVNVITKKQITGITGRAEAGISDRGDAANHRFSLTGGFGDLSSDGFNVYASGFYYKQDALFNRDRPYPYNSSNQSGICYKDNCGPQVGLNGNTINPTDQGYEGFPITTDRSLFATTFFVSPVDTTTGNQGRYQLLNPAAGCIAGETPYNLSDAEFNVDDISPRTICQGDLIAQYGVISPEVERFGGSFRATKRFDSDIEAFVEGNFLQSTVSYTGNPAAIRANGPAGIDFPRFSTAASGPPNAAGSFVLALPVYVCPLVNGKPQTNCDASNGTLNPNNPFAAQGQSARILGRIPNIFEFNETRSRTYRIHAGVTGSINDKWKFNIDATGMETHLRQTQNGYVYIQNLLNVIADGSYNFVNPYSNSQAILDYLSPNNITDAKSKLYALQASVSGALLDLPGGPLQLGVGAQVRYESINAPSANDDYAGPTERYFILNAFGTKGSRKVYSAYAEFDAPVLDWATLNAAGRYDKYSSGQSAFSPKVGVRVKPIESLTLRGTWSRGFRIPSFAESNALPTTGFVTNSARIFNNTYLAPYGCTVEDFTACPTYIRSGSYGQTQLATPDLKPEKSTSWTAGFIFEPMRNISISVDYYNIKKTGAIVPAPYSAAIAAYYTGAPIPEGYNVIADSPLDGAPATAIPRIAYVQAPFINASTYKSEGIDISLSGRFELSPTLTFSTSLEASYIINLSQSVDGTTESYEGTAGNFNLTAGSGTPKWHGSWQNTLGIDAFSATATINYFGGYNLSAADQGGTPGDCGLAPAFDNGFSFVPCDVSDYITVDLNTQYKINDQFTFYINVINLLDDLPPIDPITYGANNFNAVQGGTGIFGRQFRAGVKVGF